MLLNLTKSDRPNCDNDRRVGLRLPAKLHASIARNASSMGVPLSSYVREVLQRDAGNA